MPIKNLLELFSMYSQRQNLSKFSFPVKHLAQVAVKHLSGEIYAEAKALQGETSPLVGLGARWPWRFGGLVAFILVLSP